MVYLCTYPTVNLISSYLDLDGGFQILELDPRVIACEQCDVQIEGIQFLHLGLEIIKSYRRRPQTENRITDKDNGAPRGPRFARPPRRRVSKRKLLKGNGAPRGPRFARPPRRRLFQRKL